MARYISETPTAKAPEDLGQQVRSYLEAEGFKLVDPAQNVWKKGTGLGMWPQFVCFVAEPGKLSLQGWLKAAPLPGLYVGELGLTGFFGAVPKRKLKERVAAIEGFAR